MNSTKSISYLLSFLFFLTSVIAQTDTLINYNVLTKEITTYPQVAIDSSKSLDNTQWFYGSSTGRDYLPEEPPFETSDSGFTDLQPVNETFNVNNYPARTAVKIFFTRNDTLKKRCSGILVARDYVLTDCHCVGVYDSNKVLNFYDSLWVFPAFNNGAENINFGKSRAVEYITFKSNLFGWYAEDIAIIKLSDNLGDKTGWVGIAFNNDNNFFLENVFYKFSYPGVPDPSDTTKIYNGDTLYFNYGTLLASVSEHFGNTWLGYNTLGIQGQSGSSLIYTNNNEYFSFGTLVWSAHSRHRRITPDIFYNFKKVINNGIAGNAGEEELLNDYYLSNAYPNPFNASTIIQYNIPENSLVRLKIYDVLGREVTTLVNEPKSAGMHQAKFNAHKFASGIYIYRLEVNDFVSAKKMLLIK